MFNLQQKNTGLKTVWIGWPGIIPKNDYEIEEIEKVLATQNLDFIPIYHQEESIVSFYRFHELVLRPLFHNFKSLNEPAFE